MMTVNYGVQAQLERFQLNSISSTSGGAAQTAGQCAATTASWSFVSVEYQGSRSGPTFWRGIHRFAKCVGSAIDTPARFKKMGS